ncbi:hypothetical protein KTR66_04500 [Roseococcus sp. SDR]|uniref:hypothetical protein n=1 Tax=Roseococcus sp. SDR TaxID=2835532 RepID=UPI001BCF37FC|nr:hypothetical protein [Roseococcus sp. SDR]MBS7789239.1 hypothetical protein [Roseococcus sp. SDR]MBV1844553.1 hypothetical protein [Roseococcus sp. SDR]
MTESPDQPLTSEEMSYGGFVLGDASKGEIAVFDGEDQCATCDRVMPRGAVIYWRGSGDEYDHYCTACARKDAKNTRLYCEWLEAEHKAGRLP